MSVNKAIIVGTLGRDPETHFTKGGGQICKLSVATNHKWTNKQTGEKQEETEWHRVTVFGKQAEHCGNYLRKGRQVYIEGRLQTSSYEKDGVKKYSTDIIAERVQFLGGGEKRQSNSGVGYSAPGVNSQSDDDDGIPF